MWSSFTGALKSLTPRRQRYATESSPTSPGDGSQTPLTVLVHFCFYEHESARAAVAEFATMLSREFALGVDAIEVDSSNLEDVWRRCILCCTPTVDTVSGFDGLAKPSNGLDDDDIRGGAYYESLTSDMAQTHRHAATLAAKEAVLHVVLYGDKRYLSTLVPAVRAASVPVAQPPQQQGQQAKPLLARPVLARNGLVAMVYNTSASSHASSTGHGFSPAESENDNVDESDVTRDTLSFAVADLASNFASVYDAARAKMLSLHNTRRGDGMAVAFSSTTDEEEMSTTSLAQISCMSLADLRRLRQEQLKLLQIIVGNLNKVSENEQYGILNAGSDRFVESLGRYPCVCRTLRNLGFSPTASASPTSLHHGKTLVYGDGEGHRLAHQYERDRRRTVAALAYLIQTA